MNKNAKIALGSLGVLLFLCLGLGIAFLLVTEWQNRRSMEKMFVQNPTVIARTARGMADYNLLSPYQEAGVSKLFTTNVLYIFAAEDTPDNLSYPRITLVQFPLDKYPNVQAAREKVRRLGPQIKTETGALEVTDEITTLIRGQKVGLTTYKLLTPTGEEFRVVVSDLFAGKQGFLQLTIEGPAPGWDQEMVDAFIASIH